VFVIGHFSLELKGFAGVIDSAPLRALLIGIYYLLPNLSTFSLITPAAHGIAPPAGHLAVAALYALAWDVALVALAALTFARRDFR
ncbi:MAG TPA: hypothetical protein VMV01_08065, partial [Planctomycetota bacterium]|nr:hypothetical protein [Planctomycetota bacterium]